MRICVFVHPLSEPVKTFYEFLIPVNSSGGEEKEKRNYNGKESRKVIIAYRELVCLFIIKKDIQY
jgi:hypothetical protein